MSEYRKTVAAVVAAVASYLATQGVEASPELQGLVVTVVTAVLVYAVPNETRRVVTPVD